MEPTLKHGQLVLASSVLAPTVSSIVVVRHNKTEKIKRIKAISGNKIEIVGDNPRSSTDSRTFGPINIDLVVGTVLFKS